MSGGLNDAQAEARRRVVMDLLEKPSIFECPQEVLDVAQWICTGERSDG